MKSIFSFQGWQHIYTEFYSIFGSRLFKRVLVWLNWKMMLPKDPFYGELNQIHRPIFLVLFMCPISEFGMPYQTMWKMPLLPQRGCILSWIWLNNILFHPYLLAKNYLGIGFCLRKYRPNYMPKLGKFPIFCTYFRRKIDFRLGIIIVLYVYVHYFEIHMKLSYFLYRKTRDLSIEQKLVPWFF